MHAAYPFRNVSRRAVCVLCACASASFWASATLAFSCRPAPGSCADASALSRFVVHDTAYNRARRCTSDAGRLLRPVEALLVVLALLGSRLLLSRIRHESKGRGLERSCWGRPWLRSLLCRGRLRRRSRCLLGARCGHECSGEREHFHYLNSHRNPRGYRMTPHLPAGTLPAHNPLRNWH